MWHLKGSQEDTVQRLVQLSAALQLQTPNQMQATLSEPEASWCWGRGWSESHTERSLTHEMTATGRKGLGVTG